MMITMAKNRLLLAILIAQFRILAQAGPTIVSTTYGIPSLTVVPGQIITLQVSGLKTVLAGPVQASQTPLPTALAGISVTLNQYVANGLENSQSTTALPLLSIEQHNACDTAGAVVTTCIVTYITVEVPGDIGVAYMAGYPVTTLVVTEGSTDGPGVYVGTAMSEIHVLTGCGEGGLGGPCVTHANGALVSMGNPAEPGETLVIYAYGLGQTDPNVPAGQATPTPAPVAVNRLFLQFDFTPNAGPKLPTADPDLIPLPHPDFAGLTPGEVGLYQINVTLPASFPTLQATCSTSFPAPLPSSPGRGEWSISSNLTITISDNFGSYDGAPICIRMPNSRSPQAKAEPIPAGGSWPKNGVAGN